MSSTSNEHSEIRRSFSRAMRTSCSSINEGRVGETYRALAEWRFPKNSPFDFGGFQLTVEPPSPRSHSGGRQVSLSSGVESSAADHVSFISDPSLTRGRSFGITYFARDNSPVARISAQLDLLQFGLTRDPRDLSLDSASELVESIADELVAETRAQLVIPRSSLGLTDAEQAFAAALRESVSSSNSSADGSSGPKILVVRNPDAFTEKVKQRVLSRRAEANPTAVPHTKLPQPPRAGPKKRIPLETMTNEERAELDAKLTAFLLFYVVNSPSAPL